MARDADIPTAGMGSMGNWEVSSYVQDDTDKTVVVVDGGLNVPLPVLDSKTSRYCQDIYQNKG